MFQVTYIKTQHVTHFPTLVLAMAKARSCRVPVVVYNERGEVVFQKNGQQFVTMYH